MVRLIGVILVVSSIAVHLNAQTPKDQSPTETATKNQTASQSSMASTATTAYPLDAFTDFSAVMVGSMMELGAGTSESYIYRSGRLMRMEGPEGHGYFITNLTTLDTYGVSAGPCMHDSHPFFRASPFAAMRPGYTVERVVSGKETLDGHSCQIEDVTVSSPKPGKPLKMRFWEAEDLQDFPIRIDFERAGGNHSTVRYKNVILGPQDPTLFIYPKSCESLPQKRDEVKAPKPAKPPASASQK